jgi:hypothetical protein
MKRSGVLAAGVDLWRVAERKVAESESSTTA